MILIIRSSGIRIDQFSTKCNKTIEKNIIVVFFEYRNVFRFDKKKKKIGMNIDENVRIKCTNRFKQ